MMLIPATGGVAYAAHGGGFILGAVAARLFARCFPYVRGGPTGVS